ncbi:undecaprenyl-diphosphate phosphatase [Synechocystis sp. LKSZ1]|uniref:undecaprenyl-diphosphate phosphatase n=1 Tax=Synechocystis sp. LKSZ1 TaxID=3144951 RepID=UPI00336BFBEA
MSSRKLNFLSAVGLTVAITLFFHQAWVAAQPLPPAVSTGLSPQIDWFQAIILGVVQGLTEFLPISSTAHLKVIPIALGWGDPGVAYTAVIQLGSIVAVIGYFWADLSQISRGMVKAIQTQQYDSLEFKLALGIGIGTLPIVIDGLLLKLFVPDFDNSPLRSLTTIALASIVMALLLALAEKVGSHRRPFKRLRWQDGLVMGLAQSLALIPGVSRSGSTLTAGLFINLERAAAARFSFLLGIPAIVLAGLVELRDVLKTGISSEVLFPLVIGVISATIFSYLAIAWLIQFLQKRSTWVFVWYRLVFGVVILLFVGFNRAPA